MSKIERQLSQKYGILDSLLDVILQPLRQWLDSLETHDAKVAKWVCTLIPAQCPFERDIQFMGRTIVHIPPLCKLNPFYEQFVGLRFRSLSYLADDCGEDISEFI